MLKPLVFGGVCTAAGPAAFGRLCVETNTSGARTMTVSQPPSGGCVLKQAARNTNRNRVTQPPSGGCVLKPRRVAHQKL